MAATGIAAWELNEEPTTSAKAIASDAPISATGTLSKTTLALISYNVCAALCPDKGTWRFRAPLLAQQIAAGNPDVVTTRETGSRRNAALFSHELEQLGFQVVANEAGRYIFIKPEQVSVVRVGTVHSQRTRASKSQDFPRADIRNHSGTSTFVGVHQSPFDSKALDKDRASEATAVDDATSREGAVVLMGESSRVWWRV